MCIRDSFQRRPWSVMASSCAAAAVRPAERSVARAGALARNSSAPSTSTTSSSGSVTPRETRISARLSDLHVGSELLERLLADPLDLEQILDLAERTFLV